jgi:hypothetical protein
MFAKLAKMFAAVSLIAAIGVVTVAPDASAGACYCRQGVGGATYCTC